MGVASTVLYYVGPGRSPALGPAIAETRRGVNSKGPQTVRLDISRTAAPGRSGLARDGPSHRGETRSPANRRLPGLESGPRPAANLSGPGPAAPGRCLRPRMVPGVQAFQPLLGHVGVDLGGGQVAVAEQHLHHPQVGAVVEQVGGEGVAQGVG